MLNLTVCDYCTQKNYEDALCCQWCGAPLDSGLSDLQTILRPLNTVECSSSTMHLRNYGSYPESLDNALAGDVNELHTAIESIEEELGQDSPKRGWRDWLGIGGRR